LSERAKKWVPFKGYISLNDGSKGDEEKIFELAKKLRKIKDSTV